MLAAVGRKNPDTELEGSSQWKIMCLRMEGRKDRMIKKRSVMAAGGPSQGSPMKPAGTEVRLWLEHADSRQIKAVQGDSRQKVLII